MWNPRRSLLWSTYSARGPVGGALESYKFLARCSMGDMWSISPSVSGRSTVWLSRSIGGGEGGGYPDAGARCGVVTLGADTRECRYGCSVCLRCNLFWGGSPVVVPVGAGAGGSDLWRCLFFYLLAPG